MDYKVVTECRVCKSKDLHKYLDLGKVPLCNSLITQESPTQEKYPVQVLFCSECSLSQLSVVIDPRVLYKDYVYFSSVSNTFKKHCFDLANELRKDFPDFEYPLVVDIASNDGCLLEQFKEAGYQRFLGIEPSENLTTTYFERQLPVLNKFWSEDIAREYLWKANGADIITATNVMGHVDNLEDFVKGVYAGLSDDGIFVGEVPYLPNLINGNQFDTIYHEHLSYFLLAPLVRIFKENRVPIFKVKKLDIHGGSIRIYASKDNYEEDGSVEEMLNFEEQFRFYDFTRYVHFSTQVDATITNLRNMLIDLYNTEAKVVGYGASAKGISLLNYIDVGCGYIKCIIDDTKCKQGKMTPGTHIPIVDFSGFEKENPDYIFLLAWNFAKEMIEKTKHVGAKYIIPIPSVKIT